MTIIGISTDWFDKSGPIAGVRTAYCQAVLMAGGVPVLIPFLETRAQIAAALDRVDGLLMGGGDDFREDRLGEPVHPAAVPIVKERDTLDYALLEMALERRLPLLAICLSMQELNFSRSGTIWQDLPDQCGTGERHRGSTAGELIRAHEIEITPGSGLAGIFGGAARVEVNSLHHQAVREPGRGVRVTATAPDGTVEAIEVEGHPGVLGVQWHPEKMVVAGDQQQLKIFEWLVGQASAAKTTKSRQL